jgi:hypothetical protein
MLIQSTENLLSLAAAAKRCPPLRNGRPVSPSTLFRWIVSGIRGPNGERVRLDRAKFGRSWVTSSEAIIRFMAATTPNHVADTVAVRSPAEINRSHCNAAAALDTMGVGCKRSGGRNHRLLPHSKTNKGGDKTPTSEL